MQGINDPATQRGIIPRSFEHIFEVRLDNNLFQCLTIPFLVQTIDTSENMKYLVHASYLEIYNEDIHDLLGEDTKKKLDLKEHPDKGVYVHSKLFMAYAFEKRKYLSKTRIKPNLAHLLHE